ncbi:MAG: tetratricopeptide repeat protein, partial [Sphingorhabdus sp.]
MRIDGWKSVAAYFGKERSTVIRWASERHMPVHRIPGQKRSGVYALSHELDEWLRIANPESEDRIPVAGEAPHGFSLGTSLERMSTVARRYRTRIVIAALVLGLFVIGLGALSQGASQNDADNQLPRDRRVAALYLDARSDWAERSQPSIELAIEKLKKVVKLAPDFAPGYAALADCYVLAREFGSLEDGEAFPKAQSAIKIALRMDPTNSDALRVKGFVEYWWNGDAKMALDNFRAALRNGGSSAQTHFWLGNVLVDGGDYTEGIVQLNKARLLNPNSPAVDTDLAWAHWSSGNRELGKKMMEKLAVKYPNLATIHDYLSVMYLEDENREGFIEASRHLAELR